MITAVDTNVLLDVFRDDPIFGQSSADALRQGQREGRLVISDIVWAELAALFPDEAALTVQMSRLGIDFLPMERTSATLAGAMWREYRKHEGGKRIRMVADFLIAAHALCQSDRLLTRDRGFYRKYFTRLPIIDPTPTNRSST